MTLILLERRPVLWWCLTGQVVLAECGGLEAGTAADGLEELLMVLQEVEGLPMEWAGGGAGDLLLLLGPPGCHTERG
ncbi:hypothetical protein SKAU_G00137070 [Synaphobranchus kaupii]|uniref:Secreted protein n=1 Tax=Synaphobranchus kaupii TaxID=118154 RepID=A0A9Q1FS57_SYNKA|nr:hypothetical protein SKAU_G00137070 [Synaphobranchus kaupii]